ncbi:probable glutamate carboxypeptidase LAMP1 isoform X2 [Arachis duranensis]|uniref:Aminopeptidase NAALADL1 n=1 Tax=Arachis duranensis TaxID=130453 RepID=A0A9C6WTR6_ARADU|nr:probable glutamate carboxypeptidase LAMP1 isoform X2 [Arachis duranensis]
MITVAATAANTTTTISTLLAIATSFLLLLITSSPTTPKSSNYHTLFLSTSLSSNVSISNHLQALTHSPHIASSEANSQAANYVLKVFTSSNVPSHMASYHVLLSYPLSRSLLLTTTPQEPPFSFSLKQEPYKGDPYAAVSGEVVPTFHAYAKSGTAEGPVVYVNYGRVEDYLSLRKKMGVNVSGCVVLARYGKIFRGDIVKNAYDEGAVGVVVYSDRKDYGGGDDDGGRWFPDSKWLPPSGVQVGSVYQGTGDPSTPGWASSGGDGECERLTKEEVEKEGDVPLIPSLPVSGADGEKILRSIGGPVAEHDWQGSKDAPTYRVGPGPGILNLTFKGQENIASIQNVIGVIEGAEEPDRYVILGNHRDAWTFGAVDPNSGTAALLEIAQRFGKLQKQGWKPRRTIILCNWDAEEYGLIGSTEWVEENRELLASRAVAYLNSDCAVGGAGFNAMATPQLDELIKKATQQVTDPDNSSQSLYEAWTSSGTSPLIIQYTTHCMMISSGCRNLEILCFIGMLQLNVKNLEDEISNKDINLSPILKSIKELEKAAIKINDQRKEIEASKGWRTWKEYQMKVRDVNDRLMMAERAFTDRDGLLGMTWHKHLIYGPTKNNDYGSQSFPGIGDAVRVAKNLQTAESWHRVQHEVWRVSRVIKHASLVLIGQLT